jgi:iron complex outermembrane receptor protein
MTVTGWPLPSAAMLVLALPLMAPAQQPSQAAGGAADELTEVVVTARRIDERAQDVPISMSIFNQQQLTERNIVTSGDLATYTPSLSVDNTFGEEVTSFSIRGFVQALNTTPSVAVYFGDAVVPRGGNVGEPAGSGVAPGTFFDLQNVQVLKGPQGTLFGRNTDGGAVLLVPQKPTSEFEGYVEGGYGNYAMGEVQAVLNIPLGDNVRVRLGVNHEERNGYQQNISGIGPSEMGDLNYTAARLSVVADITPEVENYTIGSYNLSINKGALPQVFACNPAEVTTTVFGVCEPALAQIRASGPYAVENDFDGAESYLRQFQVVNTTSWKPTDTLKVKNIFNYGQLATLLDSSLFGVNFVLNGAPLIATESNPSAADAQTTDQYTWSDELQLQGDALQNKLTYQFGGYIERSGPLGDPTGTQSANFLTCTDVATFQCTGFGLIDRNFSTVHFSDVATYGQATYAILDRLKLTGGLRYTWDKTSSSFTQTNYHFPLSESCASTAPGVSLANGCMQAFSESSHAPTGLLGLDYNPVEDLLLYAKYSRGYRQGGVATFVADGFHVYAPEHVNAYEIGEKYTLRGQVSGTFNMAGFYNDFTNQQLLASFTGNLGVTPSSGIVNAGKSRIWGIELESSITPVAPLTVGLSYTYLRTELQSAQPFPPPTGGYTTVAFPSVVGGPLPYSPKNKGTADATYRLPVPDSYGYLSLGAVFTYTSGELASQTTPLSEIHPYGLLNLTLNWNSIWRSRIDASLFATNVTNRLYYSNATQGFYTTEFGFESRYLGEPRMYGARVWIRFGK